MDSISKSKRSAIMRLVKSNETALERAFRHQLWKRGVRYRKNNPSLFGKPDISIINKNVVVFVDSCFWHGCSKHARLPKSNENYWMNKIEKNKKRDVEVSNFYKIKGWKIIRVWEHQIKNSLEKTVESIASAIINS